jgi:hypothetical protein
VQDSGCRVQGSGFRVQGSGFRVAPKDLPDPFIQKPATESWLVENWAGPRQAHAFELLCREKNLH